MLKRKLQEKVEAASKQSVNNVCSESQIEYNENTMASTLFAKPFWQNFYDVECLLNIELNQLTKPANIDYCIYNPVEYAAALHCAYLQRYLKGPKRLVFVGMNPGPNGMGQTGIPFGNVTTVRDIMKLKGHVEQPPTVHPKRSITGLECTIEEPSGLRLWNLFLRLADGSLDTFAEQCFVHNFCPLAFFDVAGRNITPSELKGEYKSKIRDICLVALDQQIALLQPEIVVAVGDYVYSTMKKSKYQTSIKILRLPHPSPRSLNNQNWAEKATKFLSDNDLLKLMRNE